MAVSSTSYKPKWNSGDTMVIRIPKTLSNEIIEYAHLLDDKYTHECAEPVLDYNIKKQNIDRTKPINISKIIHRSPFRYPGGKTWFIPYLRNWLKSFNYQPEYFIEPFSGGAICSLTVAFEDWANHIIFSELDEYISSVWQTILTGQGKWLADKIENFELTYENVIFELNKEKTDRFYTLKDQAFCTILKNRVQRGGIMAPGAGLVKSGENGNGLKSRWYPQTLAKRINDISMISDKLSFEHIDGFNLIERYKNDDSVTFFIDPPYTKAAKRLYNYWEFDHSKLFEILSEVKGDFVITYDNTEHIKELANFYNFNYTEIAMKNTHNAKMTELLISRDLSWLDDET